MLTNNESGRVQPRQSGPRKRKAYTTFFSNKPFNDKLRRGFSEWCTLEVTKQLSDSVNTDAIFIDMLMSSIKELSLKWTVSAYNHILSSKDIIRNGFQKLYIIHAIENGVETVETRIDIDKDPFDSDELSEPDGE